MFAFVWGLGLGGISVRVRISVRTPSGEEDAELSELYWPGKTDVLRERELLN